MILVVAFFAIVGVGSWTMDPAPIKPPQATQDLKDLYLDTCAEGNIPDDATESHAAGFDCAVELMETLQGGGR